MRHQLGVVVLALLAGLVAAQGGCRGQQVRVTLSSDGGPDGGDTDSDTDTDSDSDSDSDTDTDTETETDTGEVIELDCSDCPGVGGTVDNMLCAIDLCDPAYVVSAEYTALNELVGDWTEEDTYEAVAHFGDPTNGLAPLLGDSYGLMASGPATGTAHSETLSDVELPDPYCQGMHCNGGIRDAFELRLILEAPEQAAAFRFHYVYFTEELEDNLDTSSFFDRFYAVLEAGSTNDGEATVINFGPCRLSEHVDFVCEYDDEEWCGEPGEYCYVSVKTGFADCCWFEGCPDGYSSEVGTDITGTGFACAADSASDNSTTGSSTGWLRTSWPIDGGETFALTFHINDTADAVYDAEVIIDAFEFLTAEARGTVKLE